MPPAYSPALDLAKPTGRKPTAVTSVPVNIGNAVDVQAKVAERVRSQPCSIFTTIISMAMIASSTRSPSAPAFGRDQPLELSVQSGRRIDPRQKRDGRLRPVECLLQGQQRVITRAER